MAIKYNVSQAVVSKICRDHLIYGDEGLKPNFNRNLDKSQEKEIIKIKKHNRRLELKVEKLKKLKLFLGHKKTN